MLETYALWSEITEPGDSIGGMLRRIIGAEQALELIRDGISARDLAYLLPVDNFQAPEFLQALADALECWRRRLATADADKSLDRITKINGQLLTPESEQWPKVIDDLGDHAPAALWLVGKAETLKQSAISVIGARLASAYGIRLTSDLVRFCVSKDWLIVSGGALGIDAKASASALECGGNTVCVMAGGLDRLYPEANLELFKLVCNSGALVSEVAPGVSPSRWRFLQRNRLIAALGKATVVVEAGYRSGSINTAGHANELGRPVGAIPGPVDSVRSAGCHRLIREQRAELIATPDQLAELMGLQAQQIAGQQFKTTEQIRVLDALYGKALSSVQVANLAGLTLSETEFTLNQLSKLGLVRQISNGWQKL